MLLVDGVGVFSSTRKGNQRCSAGRCTPLEGCALWH